MKHLLLLLLMACSFVMYGQTITAFKPLRYDEDYSLFKKDTAPGWYQQLKYTPIGLGNSYISFGAEARFQYFRFTNEGWGEEPRDRDGYIFARYLAHADLHAGKSFRAFVQLQSSLANGKARTSPVDENPLEVHQAFADVTFLHNKKNSLILRAGRQELLYGIQRILSVRDGPNNRHSFDGVKLLYTAGNYKLDAFYSHYVASKKGIFNDGFNNYVKMYGAYFTRNKLPVLQHIDLYYIGFWRDKALYDDGVGKEHRHSIGSHIWGNAGNWRYDVEGLYQFGKWSTATISAWTASLNTSYKFTGIKFSPEVGFKTEMISGDRQYNDNRLNTFYPLFPRGAYFGLAALIGPANLFDIHPSLAISLTRKLTWNIDQDIFWRLSSNDGIYGPNAALLYSGKNISDKHIGNQLATDFVYTPNPFLYFRAEFTWFNSGPFLQQAGPGKNIIFTGVTTQVKL